MKLSLKLMKIINNKSEHKIQQIIVINGINLFSKLNTLFVAKHSLKCYIMTNVTEFQRTQFCSSKQCFLYSLAVHL